MLDETLRSMLKKYLTAIWNDVVAKMSGVMSLLFTLAGTYSSVFAGARGSGYAKAFLWLAALLCFLYANYHIWVEEHQKVVSSRPRFSLAIEHLAWEYSSQDDKTTFVFAVYLVNSGAPSIAQKWTASYKYGTCNEILVPISLVGEWVIVYAQQKVTVRPEDQITCKTLEARLETGGGRAGRMFFTVNGNRVHQLNTYQFTVEITMRDAWDVPVSATFTPHSTPPTGVPIFPNEKGGSISNQLASHPGTLVPDLPADDSQTIKGRSRGVSNGQYGGPSLRSG